MKRSIVNAVGIVPCNYPNSFNSLILGNRINKSIAYLTVYIEYGTVMVGVSREPDNVYGVWGIDVFSLNDLQKIHDRIAIHKIIEMAIDAAILGASANRREFVFERHGTDISDDIYRQYIEGAANFVFDRV